MMRSNRVIRSVLASVLAILMLGGLWGVAAESAAPSGAPARALLQAPTETETPTSTPTATATPTPTDTPTITPTPSATPIQVSISSSEPLQLRGGTAGVLSIFGANFTAGSTVRLVGYGLLRVTFVNSGALTAELPDTIPAGSYSVEVSDPVYGRATSPTTLTILPPPTTPPPTLPPTSTPLPPTPVPGEPALIVRSYQVNPASIAPGGTVALVIDVYNRGNYAARGVSLAVDSGGGFVPNSMQASVILPDIGPGGSATATLTAVARSDAASGTANIPITLAYRDADGRSYSANATLSATIQEVVEASQLTLSGYAIAPNPARPGEPVLVTIQITNSGNETASQVLLRIPTTEGVLLAGPTGDSYPLGSLPPGASRIVDLSLIASPEAKAGPQNQSVQITYFQGGESSQVTGSMTIQMTERRIDAPLLLLSSYDPGQDVLQPGDRFTLTMTLQNVGTAPVSDLIVLFSAGSASDSGSGTATAGYTTFAPQGAGGTIYVGELGGAGTLVELHHDFIVDGTVNSGIYALPIQLRYKLPDGTQEEDFLQASLVVVRLPRLQFTVNAEPPEQAMVGEPFPLALTIANIGAKDVNLTFARVTATGGEVINGEETFLGTLRVLDDTALDAEILPSEAGPVVVTMTLFYLDDLNRERSLERRFETEAVLPPEPPPDEGEWGPPGLEFLPLPEEQTPPVPQGDLVGRLLLGLLGLGS